MTRIVAGSARGRRVSVPAGGGTRPTADRAREGLFSTLTSLLGTLEGVRFLDLYAGSGAVGLEALSRGAEHALLVESGRAAARVASANVAALGLRGAELQVVPVEQLVRRAPAGPPYDIVFADPPYLLSDAELSGVLRRAREQGWLAPGAVVALERATQAPAWRWPDGIVGMRFRTYGEATLWYGRAAGPGGSSANDRDEE